MQFSTALVLSSLCSSKSVEEVKWRMRIKSFLLNSDPSMLPIAETCTDPIVSLIEVAQQSCFLIGSSILHWDINFTVEMSGRVNGINRVHVPFLFHVVHRVDVGDSVVEPCPK